MKTILVAVDFSTAAPLVLAQAKATARLLKAGVILVHVVKEPVVFSEYPGVMIDSTLMLKESMRTAKSQLTRWAHDLSRAGVNVEQRTYVGAPGVELLRASARLKPEMIVIGSQGHGAFYNFMVGSTVSAVVRGARCPILVVPAPIGGKPPR